LTERIVIELSTDQVKSLISVENRLRSFHRNSSTIAHTAKMLNLVNRNQRY